MKRICLECGLLFDVSEKPRRFKKNTMIPACEYCRGRRTIDVTGNELISPFILALEDEGFYVNSFTMDDNKDGGEFGFEIFIHPSDDGELITALSTVFDSHGSDFKYSHFYPSDDNSYYAIGAKFKYKGGFAGHIGSKYSRSMIFTSYEYQIKMAEMILEFHRILKMMEISLGGHNV